MDAHENSTPGESSQEKKRLFPHTYRKRSLSRWLIPLIAILGIIIFLPRLVDLLVPS